MEAAAEGVSGGGRHRSRSADRRPNASRRGERGRASSSSPLAGSASSSILSSLARWSSSSPAASADSFKVVFVTPDEVGAAGERSGGEEGVLGFSVRGGIEHGLGIYVKDVVSGSSAHLNGLRVGDEITEANEQSLVGVSITMAQKTLGATTAASTTTYGNASSSPASFAMPLKLVVKRRPDGATPIKERLSWFWSSNESLEAGTMDTLRTGVEKKSSLTKMRNDEGGGGGRDENYRDSTENVSASPNQNHSSGSASSEDIHIRIPIPPTRQLGFNVRGGSEYGLGIFVSRVDAEGVARRHGLGVGDQIIAVDGKSCEWASHAAAVLMIKEAVSTRSSADREEEEEDIERRVDVDSCVDILVRRLGKYPAFKEVFSSVSKHFSRAPATRNSEEPKSASAAPASASASVAPASVSAASSSRSAAKKKIAKNKHKSATEAAAAAAAATWNDLSTSARKTASHHNVSVDENDEDDSNRLAGAKATTTVVEVHAGKPEASTMTTTTTTKDAEIQTEEYQSHADEKPPAGKKFEEKKRTKADSNWSRSSPSKGSGTMRLV